MEGVGEPFVLDLVCLIGLKLRLVQLFSNAVFAFLVPERNSDETKRGLLSLALTCPPPLDNRYHLVMHFEFVFFL